MPEPLLPFPSCLRRLAPCLLALAGAAHAADDPSQSVEIKGRYNERRDDTASKTIVGHAEITRFGDTSLLDVLKRLPSVTVVGGTIRMRGLGDGYTQLLLNGEKVPPGFAIESLAPDSVEKIEILRSASADMGTQAIAGTINIVTRKIVRAPRRDMKFSLGDEGGKVTPYLTLQSAGREGARSHNLVLAMSGSHFDTPASSQQRYSKAGSPTDAIDGSQRAAGSTNSIFFTPRLNWNLGDGQSFSSQSLLRFMRSHAGTTETSTLLYGSAPAYASSANASQSRSSIANTNMNWVHRLDAHKLLDAKAGLSYTDRRSEAQFAGEGTPALPSLQRMTATRAVDKGITFSGKVANSRVDRHTIVVGWDGALSLRGEVRQQDALAGEDFTVRVRRLALFAQDEWQVAPQWSAYLGLRWEGIGTYSAGSRLDPSSSRSSVWSPIGQTLWKSAALEGAQLRLALARTYKAPAVGNLNARQVLANMNTESTPDYRGNPKLRPELAWGLDVAAEYFSAAGGMVSVGAYLRRIADVTGHSLDKIAGRWVVTPDNVGDARSAGIELEAKANLQQLVDGAPPLDLRFNLNRNWSRVLRVPGPGNRLDGQTPLSLNLGVEYSLAGSGLAGGGNFSLQTGGLVRATAYESTYSGVVRNLDLYALYKYDRRNQLRLALANLLHQDTLAASYYADRQGAVARTQRERGASSARLTFEHIF